MPIPTIFQSIPSFPFRHSPVKLKRPKRQNSQAKLASSTAMTGAAAAVVSTEEQLHKMAKTSNQSQTAQKVDNGQLQQQHSQTDSTTSSSASSASSGGFRTDQHPLLLHHHSTTSSMCATPNELLLQQSLQLLGQQHPMVQQPYSLSSLQYGPFGLPSFASPQGHSLVHFPAQLQQQQALEKPVTLAATAALQMSAINTNLLATQNAYEGLPIFIVPHSGTLSLNALQRAADFKAMAINAILQQQQQQQQSKPDTSKHFHVFVGDLSQNVDNDMLKEAFGKFGEVSEAKVMRDSQSSKSRSFGFVAFPNREDAQRAIDGMNGEMLGLRPIRTGWAVRRNSTATSGGQSGSSDEEKANPSATFESIYNATEADNTTIYLGGLSNMATEEPIRSAFSQFGTVKEIRLFASQNFGFVVFADKTQATQAIMEMHGRELDLGIVGGRCKLRVKWGKPIQHGNGNGGVKINGDGVMDTPNLQLPQQALVALSQSSARLAQQQQQQLAMAAAMAVQAQSNGIQPTGLFQPMSSIGVGGQQQQFQLAQFAQPQIGTVPLYGTGN